MPSSRRQWLQRAVLTIGLLAVAPIGARLVAATRQVSVESMVYDLGSPDPLRREAAAKELGLNKITAAIPKLVALANDPVTPVRREVELALENMEDSQVMPGFIALATDTDTDIRSRSVASLVKMHLPRNGALTKLGDLIFATTPDMSVMVEPDVPVDPLVVSTLRARIGDSERGIRRTAIRGLGILRAKPAIPDLLQVVREDRDDGLRFEGVRAIRKIGDPSAAEQLVTLFNISNDSVRNELIATLGAMRYHPAVPDLTHIVEQSIKIDTACVLAMSALADIADPASITLFERFRGDANEMMRLYANEGIARTTTPSQQSAISGARLVEKSERVRAAQAFALFRTGMSEYMDELIRGLERSSTRELAREYLVETQPADRPALFAPRTISSTARAELAKVYGLMGDANALPTLEELSRDRDRDVARAAERAVRRLGVGPQ